MPLKLEDLLQDVAPGFTNDGATEGLKERLDDLTARYEKVSYLRNPRAFAHSFAEAPKDEKVAVGSTCEPFSSLFTFTYDTVWISASTYIGESGQTLFDFTVTPHATLPAYAATVFDLDRDTQGKDVETIAVGTSGPKTLWASDEVEKDDGGAVVKEQICVHLFDGDLSTLNSKCSDWTKDGSVSRIDTAQTDSFKPGAFANDFSYQITMKSDARSFTTSGQQTGPDGLHYVVDNKVASTSEAGILGGFFWSFHKADADLQYTNDATGDGVSCKIATVRSLAE